MWTPDDAGKTLLKRDEAGHGIYVGYPSYSLVAPQPISVPDMLEEGKGLCTVPSGNDLFGFWLGRQDVFIGATRGVSSHAQHVSLQGSVQPHEEDATWFFTSKGKFQGWLRARRIADAADGHAMLLRLEEGNVVATLNPDLRASRIRRFLWADGSTAIALSLFDDLRLGLFNKDGKLVLAGWK